MINHQPIRASDRRATPRPLLGTVTDSVASCRAAASRDMAAAAPTTAASSDSRPSHTWTFLRYGPTDLAPPDFFNVKEEISPKATVNATMAFTALAYVVSHPVPHRTAPRRGPRCVKRSTPFLPRFTPFPEPPHPSLPTLPD